MGWQLQYGQEIYFEGSRQECIDHYRKMPNPFPMVLIQIIKEKEIFSHCKKVCLIDK